METDICSCFYRGTNPTGYSFALILKSFLKVGALSHTVFDSLLVQDDTSHISGPTVRHKNEVRGNMYIIECPRFQGPITRYLGLPKKAP